MKRSIQLLKATVLLLFAALVMPGCLKDTCTRTYTLLTPVYKTMQQVRANIRNAPSEQIESPGKLFMYGNYIFLNEVDKGVHVIDNTNPAQPVNKYFITIPGNVDVAVRGNILYADMYSDMVTIDISNPSAIQLKGVVNNAFPERRYSNGFVADTAMVIVDWARKDTMVECMGNMIAWERGLFFDAGIASVQSAVKSATGIAGSMARFSLMNEYLYTVSDNALNVFNVLQPESPVFTNKVNLGWGIETIFPFKSNLFIGSTTGMFIFGTGNPAAPNQISRFTHMRACDPVIADDDYAFVTLRTGNACEGFNNQLDVLDIKNLQNPTLLKSYALKNPHGLSKDGNLLFICDGASGLKVYNAANVRDLVHLQTIEGIDTYDVIATNNIALVVAKDGLYQYSYANPADLKLLSKMGITKN